MDQTFEFSSTQTASGTSEASTAGIKAALSVVCKQLIESPESNFQMFGMPFGIFSLAVIIRSIESSSTKITYVLEDHTGQIEGHYWLEDDTGLKSPDVMVDNYALVHGCLRQQGEMKNLMIMKMEQINDPNVLTTHLLEVLHSRYRAEEFQKRGSDYDMQIDENNPMLSNDFRMKENDVNLGLQAREFAIYNLIKHSNSQEGISRNELHKKMQHVTKDELDSMLEFLQSEGHIYTTKDVDHFLVTSC